MTASGLLFLLIGLAITGAFSSRRFLSSRLLPWLLFFYHLFFSLIYWRYSLANPADSHIYYNSIGQHAPFDVSTAFIKWIMSRLDFFFSASYLDYFLLFQLFGFVGFCLLYNAIAEVISHDHSKNAKRLLNIIIFLPNLHFWTSAIGKDSLIFFGITLSIWSLMKYRTRMAGLIAGLIITYFVRPHVAGFFMASILLALLWGMGLTLRWRIAGTIAITVVIFMLLPKITDFVGLETLSTESVSIYLDKRQGYTFEGGSAVDIRDYNIPLKFFTFLFRPLFFDAKGTLWWMVSVENLILLILAALTFSRKLWPLLFKYRVSFFMRFNFFFFLVGLTAFSLSIANMGIAIRQKTMLMPSFIIIAISVYALKLLQQSGIAPDSEANPKNVD